LEETIIRHTLSRNISRVQQRITQACERAGRSPQEIQLIWVSKTRSLPTLLEASKLGAKHLGENKVQEILDKFPLPLPNPPELHFIGHLQSNKTRKILPVSHAIHSVDSPKLFETILRVSEELETHTKLFFQINVSGENSKFGFSPDSFSNWVKNLPNSPWLQYEGLMTMAPHTENLDTVRSTFKGLRLLSKEIQSLSGPAKSLTKLSMGMSRDFEVAIEEGSHYIRVGTELFGPREY
jgi:pyridoxal phosphate enzyme (YggS family)